MSESYLTATEAIVQRQKDDLVTAVVSASRQLANIRAALEALKGEVSGGESMAAAYSLQQAESSVTTIGQIAERWGGQR